MNELGSLSQCIMDGDLEGLGKAKSIRRKAFLASTVLEFGLVAALLAWPLITPGVLKNRVVVLPLPPFHGLAQAQAAPQHSNQPPSSQDLRLRFPVSYTPLGTPQRTPSETSDIEPPGIGDPLGIGIYGVTPLLPGGGSGPAVVAPPHTPASAARPLQVSSGVMQAALIHRVEPTYPAIAKAMHLEGVVHLRAIIRTDGSVGELTLVDGNPILGIAAEAAVRDWRYKPTLLSGQPVEVETIITVNFVLN